VPRRARADLPSGVYHVTNRGIDDAPIYVDDIDRKTFLTLLGGVVARHDWTCHAFCLMTTHYHLIVETDQPNLSRGMRRLNGAMRRASTSATTGAATSSAAGIRST